MSKKNLTVLPELSPEEFTPESPLSREFGLSQNSLNNHSSKKTKMPL